MDIAIDERGKKGTCDLYGAMRQGSALRLESMLCCVLLCCCCASTPANGVFGTYMSMNIITV